MMRDHLDEHATAVGNLVRASGADIGGVIDPDGERLILIDDEGHVLSDSEALLALIKLLPAKILGDRIALPVNTTQAAAGIAAEHGTHILWTKLSSPALMDAATEPDSTFTA